MLGSWPGCLARGLTPRAVDSAAAGALAGRRSRQAPRAAAGLSAWSAAPARASRHLRAWQPGVVEPAAPAPGVSPGAGLGEVALRHHRLASGYGSSPTPTGLARPAPAIPRPSPPRFIYHRSGGSGSPGRPALEAPDLQPAFIFRVHTALV